MTKADLIEQLHMASRMTKSESADIVEELLSIMKETLANGEQVKVSGFGNYQQ